MQDKLAAKAGHVGLASEHFLWLGVAALAGQTCSWISIQTRLMTNRFEQISLGEV